MLPVSGLTPFACPYVSEKKLFSKAKQSGMMGSAKQGGWVTSSLSSAGFLYTSGLASCTGLALTDRHVHVASLAHFDGGETVEQVAKMLKEMEYLGARPAKITAYLVGGFANMTAAGVYNCLKGQNFSGEVILLELPVGSNDFYVFGNGTVGCSEPFDTASAPPPGLKARIKKALKKLFH
jgi:Protein N-terminal asparagine amidohydrolase